MSLTAVLVGPATVRPAGDSARAAAELAAIDDEFAMTDDGPVAVARLWRNLFESVLDGSHAVLVCPSWWSDRRVAVVSEAARAVVAEAVVVRRAELLASACAQQPVAVIEIAESSVALTRPPGERPDRVVLREDPPQTVADHVASTITGRGLVVIDRPDGVARAAELGAMIADRLRARRVPAIVVGDDQLLRTAESQANRTQVTRPAAERATARRRAWHVAVGVAATVVLAAVAIGAADSPSSVPPITLVVEGRVAVELPTTWPARRVSTGPGSVRVQASSPTDPEAAVHITQSPVPADETLQRTAETLRRALHDQPPGVFVEFDADDRSSGRPAVTYREIRAGHDIRWTVFLDGSMRISVGCQSAHGSQDAVRQVCERAVTSARGIGELAGTVAAQPRSNTT